MLLLSLFAGLAYGQTLDVHASGAAGVVGALPAIGAEVDAVFGMDALLQARGEAGIFARTYTDSAAFEAFYPLAATVTWEAALGIPVGERSRIGPAYVADRMVVHAAEQDCDSGCRFRSFVGGERGPALTRSRALGMRWSRLGDHELDLGVAIQPYWTYDWQVVLPRIDVDWRLPSGWVVGAEVNHYAFQLEVGHTLDAFVPWSRR